MRLIGHRGARGEAPENTLGGFRYLRTLGVRAVELDVRMMRDGTLAIMHDDNLMRTAGVPISLNALYREDLSRQDNRQGWPNWPDPEPIPTLSQALTEMSEFQHIEVEVKPVNDLAVAYQLIDRLLHQLSGWREHAIITSFDLKILQALQQSRSPMRRGLLIETLTPKDDPIEMAQRLGCVQIGIKDALCSARIIERAHAEEMRCSVWTVNDLDRARQLAYWGADGLITDYPYRMLTANIGEL
jgi:glycerophosphoryl diester phosphodiesterase